MNYAKGKTMMTQTKMTAPEFEPHWTLVEIALAIANWEAYLKKRPESELAKKELAYWNKLKEESDDEG